jgi:hypothetical protein
MISDPRTSLEIRLVALCLGDPAPGRNAMDEPDVPSDHRTAPDLHPAEDRRTRVDRHVVLDDRTPVDPPDGLPLPAELKKLPCCA